MRIARWHGRLVFAVSVAALVPAAGATAQAPIGVPSTFWGTVAIDGRAVPAGVEVRGLIDGKDCTQLGDSYRTVAVEDGVSNYAIEVMHESQEPGCGVEGSVVTFTVSGVEAGQSVPWAFGPTRIDLTIAGGQSLPLATATPSPTPPAAGQTATATAAAVFTPRTGTPPLGTVNPRDATDAGAGTPVPPLAGDDGESGESAAVPLAIGALVLAGAAGAGGWWLVRRAPRRRPG